MITGKTSKGLLLVFSTAIISGFAIFINKFAVSSFDPYLFAFLKNLLVSLFIVSTLIGLKEFKNLKKLKKKDWGLLSLIGLVGGSIPFLLFFKGLSLTSAANGAFIHKSMFIYVVIIAGLLLKEKISNKILITAVLLLIGNLFFLKFLPYTSQIGDLFILAATLFWAFENVISKHALKKLSPQIVAFGRMGIGSIFIALFLLITGRFESVFALSAIHWQWTLLSSAILFGYVTTWYAGLKYIKVTTATIILLIGTPITSSLSYIFLGQNITFPQFIGVIFILFGLGITISLRMIWLTVKSLPKLIYVARN